MVSQGTHEQTALEMYSLRGSRRVLVGGSRMTPEKVKPTSCLNCTAGEAMLTTFGHKSFCHEVNGVVWSTDAKDCECFELREADE